MNNKNQTKEEKIIARLLRLKKVGLFTIEYWNIIVSTQGVYFFQAGANALPFQYGFIADILFGVVGKMKEKDRSLDYFKSRASRAIKVNKDQLNSIEFKDGLLRKKVILHMADKSIKFKMFSKKAKVLKRAIRKLNNLSL